MEARPCERVGAWLTMCPQRVCVCVCACMQTRACVPAAGCLGAPPSSSLPCMQHPSMATEKPSAGGTGRRGCGAERAGGVNPPRSAAPPPSITTLRPLRWCSSVVATAQANTSWCGDTSRRPGRKTPSLHGRRQGPTGPARPPFHPPSSRATPANLFVEPCPGAGDRRGWTRRRGVFGYISVGTQLAAPLPLSSRLWA